MNAITLQEFKPEGVTQTCGRIDTFEQAEREMFYRAHLSGYDGMHYELLREKQHTPDDISAAKDWLHDNFDVLSIKILKEK